MKVSLGCEPWGWVEFGHNRQWSYWGVTILGRWQERSFIYARGVVRSRPSYHLKLVDTLPSNQRGRWLSRLRPRFWVRPAFAGFLEQMA